MGLGLGLPMDARALLLGAAPLRNAGAALPRRPHCHIRHRKSVCCSHKRVNSVAVSLEWLTTLVGRGGRGDGSTPIPTAKVSLPDLTQLLQGSLFLLLFKWMGECGPVYRLTGGPINFIVVSDPAAAKHVLKNYGKYAKGLVSEVAEFLFGSGFATAEGELWMARRRAVVPSLHRNFLSTMVDGVFCKCAERLIDKLDKVARTGEAVNMEALFSQLTLDVIGLSVFNYDFDALTTDSPVIQAVYTALKETELRATDFVQYWKVPLLCQIDPRQRKASKAVSLIRDTVEELVQKCKDMVEAEGERLDGEEYVNKSDPSVLRFLLASREEVSSQQLRDDLLSMLVAGHETTGSVLTWTIYLLSKSPSVLAKVQVELDTVLKGRAPTLAETRELKYLTRCINESMRLYPHPPVLIRRAQEADILPGGYKLEPGQNVMISVYNIHHSPAIWDRAEDFVPERFGDGQIPNESNTDFRYIPFSGGARKCVGDQFAMLEALVTLAMLLQRFEIDLVPGQEIGMTTGATIHTTKGLYMTVRRR